ncbi:DUF5615 family PIN-like protein [Mucilaginibacter arboris]|uniref:DUF5615 domain-containing protein n=1 Tax=Mucilaginibacter arboris TaxID=2682090 RepID=A0A7K1T1C4_9SPHI|nr:DUF5615 family PIN-like protein [Mucilaginibacter arboris]MVN23328.1 hypothetical protein [Mucilaginibacter arboris]
MRDIKLIADENVSWRIKKLLKDWDILPVVSILTNQRVSDHAIWKYAKANNYHILTFDEDFTAIQNLLGSPPKIIWLRTGNLSTNEIASKLLSLETEIISFLLDTELGVFEIT